MNLFIFLLSQNGVDASTGAKSRPLDSDIRLYKNLPGKKIDDYQEKNLFRKIEYSK